MSKLLPEEEQQLASVLREMRAGLHTSATCFMLSREGAELIYRKLTGKEPGDSLN